MGLPKLLTEQQKKFCELLVYNEGRKTPTECALEAGYAEGSAHVRASELRNPNKFPLVVKHIGELRTEDLSIEQLEAKMKKIYEDNQVLIEGDFKEVKGA